MITLIFVTPMARFFGSPDDVLPYAQVYMFITALGFPVHLFEAGASHFVRAAGRPNASMVLIMAGCVVNIILDTVFVAFFGWGMEGAAAATVIGQAVVGIITKVSSIFLSVITGVGQGVQTIASYNYGAKRYGRVCEAFRLAITVGFIIGTFTFLLYQIFPRQIISLFGEGSSEVYYQFASLYFRIYLMLAFVNFLPQLSSTLFSECSVSG